MSDTSDQDATLDKLQRALVQLENAEAIAAELWPTDSPTTTETHDGNSDPHAKDTGHG